MSTAIISDGKTKIVVKTEDLDAIQQIVDLFNSLVEADEEEKKFILKAIEIWSYRHPKELKQIKEQIGWRFDKNA